jgi:MFS transporter, ACS family, hexuronate transporter
MPGVSTGSDAARPSPAAPHARPGGWAVAVAATLGMSVSYIDRQTLAAIAPAVRAALDIDHTQFGWLLSAFSMAYLVGAPTAGVVVDRLGARRGFAVAVVVWSIVAGAHALVTSFAMLFALRILLGAAEAPSFPAAAQAIRLALPPNRRSAAYGLLFTGSSIGAMIAAPLALSIEGAYGFRTAFVGTTVVGLAWIPLWLGITRRGRLPREKDVAASASVEPRPRWLDVVRSPAVLRAVVAVVGSAPLLMFVLNFTPQYLVERWNLPRLGTRWLLVVAPLMFDIGAVGFGWWASRREKTGAGDGDTHIDLFLGASVMAASLVLAPLAPSPTIAVWIFGVAACGGGGIYVLATADMLRRVPLGSTSSAGGMTAAAQSLAHIIASPLVGMAIDRTHGYGAALVGLGLAVIPTSLAFALWPGMRAR